MPRFALVDSRNAVLRFAEFDAEPADPVGKGWRWLPVVVQLGAAEAVDVGLAQVTRTEIDPASLVPAAVEMRQARLALLGAGLLDKVDAAIAGMDRATQIAWEFADPVHRDSATLAGIAAGLGLTSKQVDDLFRSAAAL